LVGLPWTRDRAVAETTKMLLRRFKMCWMGLTCTIQQKRHAHCNEQKMMRCIQQVATDNFKSRIVIILPNKYYSKIT